MIYKRCSKCGKRIPSGTSCPDCKREYSKREYSKPEGTRKLYHTARWQKLRVAVLSRYSGMDLWALHHHGRIEYAETVHHIIPTAENETMFFMFDNLIPVSRSSHDEIHERYKKDKQKTQEELRRILEAEAGKGE